MPAQPLIRTDLVPCFGVEADGGGEVSGVVGGVGPSQQGRDSSGGRSGGRRSRSILVVGGGRGNKLLRSRSLNKEAAKAAGSRNGGLLRPTATLGIT